MIVGQELGRSHERNKIWNGVTTPNGLFEEGRNASA